jgi:hypothetical protein
MSREEIDMLFEEYAVRFARGENPDVRDFLARAADSDRDELARLLDGFLVRATPPSPDPETIELVRAWRSGEAPLLVLRKRRRLRVDDVAAALVKSLGIDESKRAKVKRYYQQLETGVLSPGRVNLSVFRTLGELLVVDASELAALRPRPPEPEPVFFRSVAEPAARVGVDHPPVEERDEVDRLFGIDK